MRFLQTLLHQAVRIEPDAAEDERGRFERSFCAREFATAGLPAAFVQHSQSCSFAKGTLRGMHFQKAPHGESKLVRCLRGCVWDVIIDLRETSPTYLHWQGFELASSNRHQLYVPEGFAHGFQTLCDDVEMGYLISTPYAAEFSSGVRHDDPAFGIVWPLPIAAISSRDLGWPDYL
ncbi:dTDP-4-dehydrorhamnose 3,5-epimerase family protein [Kaistia terrae]|uniref:dTDP-4-dehydrorhamnose 3,5-epimerase n=1 Tax=Kaistia terrae TaxID=537017 RepID=A0ABW0Q3D9_9HYPH|nr:dTDP-4-dehydrorhamnose 3,5-epimerase [Kaistia terrae]MCX5578600.1 dTDP-4-dehydrorhamnose 3,5-epimerase [Kaistia terrae]